MAANYWASTQRRHWQFSRQNLAEIRQRLEERERQLIQQYPLPDLRLLSIFFNQQLVKLGKRIAVRQQALATAQVYIRRFYSKVEIRQTNPYLLIATALYLACKMEECPQHIRVVVSEARQMWPEYFVISDVAKLGECEFYLISELNSQMIVHHPYRTLNELQNTLNLGQDDVSLAWSVINDHYLTDLPLLYPPYVIALTAVFLALTLKPTTIGQQVPASNAIAPKSSASVHKDTDHVGAPVATMQETKVEHLVSWLAESEVDLKAMIDCSQEIISLYDIWEQWNEKTCKEQIARFIRTRGLDR
ncbi:MAG: hypothetical protein Q9163_001097 [Psora crenata]